MSKAKELLEKLSITEGEVSAEKFNDTIKSYGNQVSTSKYKDSAGREVIEYYVRGILIGSEHFTKDNKKIYYIANHY